MYHKDPPRLTKAQREVVKRFKFFEVTNSCYGTIALGGHEGNPHLKNSILIRKGTKIPCEVSSSFYTIIPDQESIECKITECDREESDPDYVKISHEEEPKLPYLRGGRPKSSEIKVTYSYDENKIMRCRLFDVALNHSLLDTKLILGKPSTGEASIKE